MSLATTVHRIEELLPPENVVYWRTLLEAVNHLPTASRKFSRIAEAADIEQLEDLLAEIRYILVFVGLNFDVEMEPLGKKGPDIKIARNGHDALVEIKRFREIYPGPPIFSPSMSKLPVYGNPTRDTYKVYQAIKEKTSQLSDQTSIIAIWNDDNDMEEIEAKWAVRALWEEIEQGSKVRGLVLVVYGSKWKGEQELYCFPVKSSIPPHIESWTKELNSARVNELIKQAIDRLSTETH